MKNLVPRLVLSSVSAAALLIDSIAQSCIPFAPPGDFVEKNIITDFGADPLDPGNDQLAFEAATAYFQARHGHGVLYIPHIPGGVYIVGRQVIDAEPSYLNGIDMLRFYQCENLIIKGDELNGVPQTRIKLDDCLRYGRFEPNPTPGESDRMLPACGCFSLCGDEAAELGEMIYLDQCSNVSVLNLDLDGNMDGLVIGGGCADGIQAGADGFFIVNSGNINIQNCNAHHQGRDGFLIYATATGLPCVDAVFGTDYQTLMGIYVANCTSEFNGRQGMSLSGGNGVHVDQSRFNFNGTGKVRSSLMAGLDIEYESTDFYEIKHCTFDGCEFLGNKNWGVISDSQTADQFGWHSEPVEDLVFTGCAIAASDNGYAIMARSRGMHFNRCKIFGSTLGVYNLQAGEPLDYQTIFHRCQISDRFAGEGVGPADAASAGYPGAFIIDAPHAGGLLIDSCGIITCCSAFGPYVFGNAANHALVRASSWTYVGNSSNRFQAACDPSTVDVSGFFNFRYPTNLPQAWGWNNPSWAAVPNVFGVATGLPPQVDCGSPYPEYMDPATPAAPLCYTGNGCEQEVADPVFSECGTASCAENPVALTLNMPLGGATLSWSIYPQGSSVATVSGGPFTPPVPVPGQPTNAPFSFDYCLPDGCYVLEVNSSNNIPGVAGDASYYTLSGEGGVPIILSNGNWSGLSTISPPGHPSGRGFCLPTATIGMVGSSGVQTRHIGAVLKCTPDPTVQSNFSTTNTTYGYQYWLFDPHGTYSRRWNVTHADAFLKPWGVNGPDDATYTLPGSLTAGPNGIYTHQNVTLNMKVRPLPIPPGLDEGFGYAFAVRFRCEVDSNVTELDFDASDDIVGQPTESCGPHPITQQVCANPIHFANRYNFYYNTLNNLTQANTYNFCAPPHPNLVPGNTYQAKVRISYNGGAAITDWCQFGASCTFLPYTMMGSQEHMPMDPTGVDGAVLSAWPNPSDGPVINLSFENLPVEQINLPMRLVDPTGRVVRVFDQPLSGSSAAIQIDVSGVSPGYYFLDARVGDQVLSNPILIQ